MISLDTIEKEIRELEARGETTYSQCERLAWLYTCRDHLAPRAGRGETAELSGSEFLDACNGASYPALMKVLDEHMDAIKVVHGQEYSNVLAKVRALGR